MEMLMMLTYAGLCIAVFKVFKLPLNKWTVPTAVLGGGVLISVIMLVMNFNHPYSEYSREYFITTPVVPNISGQVMTVDARPNQPLKAGDLLFTVDPTPFEARIESLQARIEAAEEEYERQKELFARRVSSARDLDRAESHFEDLQGQLHNAEFDLKNTRIVAPTDGFITQNFLRPGMRAVSAPLRPLMVFVHTQDAYMTAFFRQNSMQRLRPGGEAEIALDGVPGKVFRAEIMQVNPVMQEGQLQASGNLLTYNPQQPPGRIAVVLKITDPDFAPYADQLPLGAFGQVAVYTEHAHHFAVIRKILLRMASWMNYIYPLH